MNASNSLLERCQWAISNIENPALSLTRAAAAAALNKDGLPTKKWENWKYTDIQRALAEMDFSTGTAEAAPPGVESFGLNTEVCLFVFVNGRFMPDLSGTGAEPGLHWSRLTLEQSNTLPGTPNQRRPFAALNNAMFTDGLRLDVAAGAQLQKPLHVLFLTGKQNGASCYPRLLIDAGRDSRFSVIEHYAGYGESDKGFTDAITDIQLQQGSRLDYYRFNRELAQTVHVGAATVRQEAASRLRYFGFCGGGKMLRNDIEILLQGAGAECDLNGVYLCSGSEHIDNHITIEHQSGHCTSRCLFKGSAGDKSKAVFNGRVHIHPHAQGSDAVLYSRNLLLSPQAEVNTKPELEIYNDNVKAAHGATVSQIDPMHVHYLRTRAIGTQDAHALLNYAFVNDVVERIEQEAIRATVNAWVLNYFSTTPGLKKLLTA